MLNSAKIKVREEVNQLSVQKIWSGDTTTDRPKEVYVDIRKLSEDNGILQKISDVVLSAENDWTYSWKDENPQENGTWKVSEQKISSGENDNSGYTVEIYSFGSSQDKAASMAFQIKNTKKGSGGQESQSSHIGTSTGFAGIVKTGDTRNLWLPVVCLVTAGVLLLLLGWKLYRENAKK